MPDVDNQRVKKPVQPMLIPVARVESKTQAEIRRRGGPAEVSLKRYRGIAQANREHQSTKAEERESVLLNLPRLGRMR